MKQSYTLWNAMKLSVTYVGNFFLKVKGRLTSREMRIVLEVLNIARYLVGLLGAFILLITIEIALLIIRTILDWRAWRIYHYRQSDFANFGSQFEDRKVKEDVS